MISISESQTVNEEAGTVTLSLDLDVAPAGMVDIELVYGGTASK